MKEKVEISLKDLSFSELKERLAKAHSHKFFFESVYLISVLIENRIDRLIKVADISLSPATGTRSKSKTKAKPISSLPEKIKAIKEIVEADKPENDLLNQHLDGLLINDVSNWLEERNNILKALTDNCPEPGEIAELVFSGEMVATNLAYCVKQYKKNVKAENKDS